MTLQPHMSRRFLAGAMLCAAVAQAGAVVGEDVPRDYDALLRRLYTAERRLEDLESRRVERLPDVDPRPPAAPVSHRHAPAVEAPIAQRLTELENAWAKEKEAERAAAEAAEVAAREKDKYVYVPPKEPTFELGGRIHLDYWGFPEDTPGIGFFENPTTGVDPENRVAFRRIRLEFGGDIFETMLWRIQLDFNSPGEPEMKDVYLGFRNLPHNQQLLIGNQKRPLGLDHLNSSRFNVFMERPLVVEAFNEDARRTGIAMYGYSDDLIYTWRYGTYLLDNITTSGEYIGDSMQASGNVRLSCCPWYDECSGGRGYLHLAVAGMVARPDGDAAADDANANEARFRTRPEARSTNRWINTEPIVGARWYEIAAAEFMLNVNSWQFVSEYQTTWVQRDNNTVGTGPDVNFHGAYAQLSYFLTGEFMPYNRKTSTISRVHPLENFFFVPTCDGCRGTGWGAWQIAARVSYLDLSDEDILGGDERNVTLGMNWYWTSHSKVQFNAIFGEIDQHAPVGGFTSGDFWIVGTRFMADF